MGPKSGPKWAAPRTPGEQAARRVPQWPGGVGKRNGLAAGHARSVWTQARAGVISRAGSLWALVDHDERALGGQLDLAFLATVGAHIRRCEDCWVVWIDQEVPAELLTAALRRTQAWAVFRPLLEEVRAAQGRSRRSRGSA